MLRPAIATPIPRPGNPALLLDAGANLEVRPVHLVQFGVMGALLCRDRLTGSTVPAWACSISAPSLPRVVTWSDPPFGCSRRRRSTSSATWKAMTLPVMWPMCS